MLRLVKYVVLVLVMGMAGVGVGWGKVPPTVVTQPPLRLPQPLPEQHTRLPSRNISKDVYVSLVLAGGLNNQRICLANGIGVAILSNRVTGIILPEGLQPFVNTASNGQVSQKKITLSTFFNTTRLKRVVEGRYSVTIHDALPKGVKKVKTILQKTSNKQTVDTMLTRIDDALDAHSGANYLKLKCQFNMDWTAGISQASSMIIEHLLLEAIRPPDQTITTAGKIIQKLGGIKGYDTVHIRAEPDWVVLRAAGVKKMLGGGYSEVKVVRDEIESALRAVKESKRKVYIVGGVGCSNPVLHEVAVEVGIVGRLVCGADVIGVTKGSAVSPTAMTPQSMSYGKAGVDMEVGIHSAVFHGRDESSFSFFVGYYRRSRDLHAPSPIFTPKYEGTPHPHCFGYRCTPTPPPLPSPTPPIHIELPSSPTPILLLSYLPTSHLSVGVYLSQGLSYPAYPQNATRVSTCDREKTKLNVLVCYVRSSDEVVSASEVFVSGGGVEGLRRKGVVAHTWVI